MKKTKTSALPAAQSKTAFDPQVSYFQSTTRPCIKIQSAPEGQQYIHVPLVNGPLLSIFERIRTGFWLELIRLLKAHRDGWEKSKKRLACFTPSGTFRLRLDFDLLEYSHIVHLDYDDIEKPENLKARFAKSPYTLAAFISPSLNGLKVFVRVDTRADDHVNQAFNSVRKMFDDLAGIKSDPTARNLSRLCYVSYDPEIYVNMSADVFNVPAAKNSVTIPDRDTLSGSSDGLFTWIFNLTQKGKFQGETFPAGYSHGDRNNFLFLFACNCNRYGLDKLTTLEYVKSIWVQNNEGFTFQELGRSVDSAYRNRNEHASFNLPKHLK